MKTRHRIVVVTAVIFAWGASCTGFREDEIACERAVGHMQDCCPDFHAESLSCFYSESHDCNDALVGRQYPALSEADSACLLSTSCDDVVKRGLCAKVAALPPRLETIDGGPGVSGEPRNALPSACAAR